MNTALKDKEYRRAWYTYMRHRLYVWLYKWRTLPFFGRFIPCYNGRLLTADGIYREIMTLPTKISDLGIDSISAVSETLPQDIRELIDWAIAHKYKKLTFYTHNLFMRAILKIVAEDPEAWDKMRTAKKGEILEFSSTLKGIRRIKTRLWRKQVNSLVLYQLGSRFPEKKQLLKRVRPIQHYKAVVYFEL